MIAKATTALPVKIYKRTGLSGERTKKNRTPDILARFRVFLKDKPGSLAEFSSLISRSRGNISFFHYDRSIDSSRVVVEVLFNKQKELIALINSLKKKDMYSKKQQMSKMIFR